MLIYYKMHCMCGHFYCFQNVSEKDSAKKSLLIFRRYQCLQNPYSCNFPISFQFYFVKSYSDYNAQLDFGRPQVGATGWVDIQLLVSEWSHITGYLPAFTFLLPISLSMLIQNSWKLLTQISNIQDKKP